MSKQGWLVTVAIAILAIAVGGAWMKRDAFLPVDVGSTAPEFSAVDLSGKPVRLADLRGKVVLLNVWATWCAPCREEMPSMERLHRRLGPQGLEVVAVSIDAAGSPAEDRKLVADFARELGLTFTIWHNPSGDIQRAYRTTGVPESFVLNRQGEIVKKALGAEEWDSEANVELITRLLRS